MILGGLWFDKEKPTMNLFLKPLVESLNELYHKGWWLLVQIMSLILRVCIIGIEVVTECGIKTIKVAMIAVTCDLPARCLLLNMRQFNGAHACSMCEDEGATRSNNHLFRWWPYSSSSILRTKNSLIEDSINATQKRKPVMIAMVTLHVT